MSKYVLFFLNVLLWCALTGCQATGLGRFVDAPWSAASGDSDAAPGEGSGSNDADFQTDEFRAETPRRNSDHELSVATNAGAAASPPDVDLAAYNQPAEELIPPAEDLLTPRDELLTPADGEAPDEAWRLEDLEQIALNNNPALAQAWAKVQAAQGRWLQAGLPPNTVLGYSGQQLGSAGLAEQEGVYIGQQFVRLRKLRLNRLVAAQEINVAQQEAQVQQQRLLTDVRLGYYEMLVAQRRLDLTKELVAVNQGAVDIATSLFDAKEVGQPDVLRATIELQSSQLLLKAARNQFDAAWSRLSAVLGTPGAPPPRIAGQLEVELADISEADAMARILGSSPELASALAEVDRARFAVERERVEPLPDIDVQGVVQHDNGTGSSNGNLQVTVPIPWLNRNQGGIRAAEAEVIAAQRAVARTELSLQRRLATVYQHYATARVKVEGFSGPDGILANVKKSLDAVRANYQGVETSYIDLLTAQRTYAQMNLAYVESVGELWAAISEIDGLLLKDSLDSPPK
ncbi:MAG: TolC family protein [Pirellulaceae bacterium]